MHIVDGKKQYVHRQCRVLLLLLPFRMVCCAVRCVRVYALKETITSVYTHYGLWPYSSVSPSFLYRIRSDREVGISKGTVDSTACGHACTHTHTTIAHSLCLALLLLSFHTCTHTISTFYVRASSPSYPYARSLMFTLFWFWYCCHRYRCTVCCESVEFLPLNSCYCFFIFWSSWSVF